MPRFLSFFVVLLVVVATANAYIYRRVVEIFRLGRRGRIAVRTGLIAGLVALPAARILAPALSDGAARAVGGFVLDFELTLLIATLLFLVLDLVRAVARRIERVATRPRRAAPVAPARAAPDGPDVAAPPPSPALPEGLAEPTATRRELLWKVGATGALAWSGGAVVYGSAVGRHNYVVEEVPVVIPGLPKELDGFTIAQISDLHFGLYVGEYELSAAIELLRKARPDLVVLTGNLVDHDLRFAPLAGALARRAGELAKFGVAAVPGNHDHYAGVDDVMAALRKGGADVLRNAGRIIGEGGRGFALLGVEDVMAGREDPRLGPDLGRAALGVSPDAPRVLLCHNPSFFPHAAPGVALQLSGHTHGGQVNLAVRPLAPFMPYGYVAGLYERGGSKLYVNRGFGTAGPPARLGSAPEVTRIVLVAG